MPIPLPVLDSRNWIELVAEGRALIPRVAPRWTDHNPSDPGITLMELFAWLSEMQLYRLDRVTHELMRAFLRFYGVVPRPAGIAEVVVAAKLTDGGSGPITVPAGTRASDGVSGVAFATVGDAMIGPAWIDLEAAA